MTMMPTQQVPITCLLALFVATTGCVSVPPQVAKTHQKQLEILESLEKSHLAILDSMMDQKVQVFERFFFEEYGPVFLGHWMTQFLAVNRRPYDSTRDFPTLYNDLVAEYQAEVAPIEELRVKIRNAIKAEYRNALAAHKTVGEWLDSLEKLNAAQRRAVDDLFGAMRPMVSLDSLDKAIETARTRLDNHTASLSEQH